MTTDPGLESRCARSEARAGSNRVLKIAAPQLIASIELALKGFARARNQHYLQLWRPAA
jgi:hypothetical protein